MEKAGLGDFKAAPTDGVLIGGDSDQTRAAGLKRGDVIVSLGGRRVHDFIQYQCERDLLSGTELDLIVWQGNGYHEIKASPPGHLFGVDFFSYPSNK
jgi:S1-C subfamily serine protease